MIRAVLFLLAVFAAQNASADILQLEREASARHGRPVRCIGWPAECHIMLTKINRSVLPDTKATVALTPMYNVVTSYKAVTQINFRDVLMLPQGDPVVPSKTMDPGSWLDFTNADA